MHCLSWAASSLRNRQNTDSLRVIVSVGRSNPACRTRSQSSPSYIFLNCFILARVHIQILSSPAHTRLQIIKEEHRYATAGSCTSLALRCFSCFPSPTRPTWMHSPEHITRFQQEVSARSSLCPFIEASNLQCRSGLAAQVLCCLIAI